VRDTEINALLTAELDDIRAALDWAIAGDHAECGASELLAAIGVRWYFLGLQREGRDRLDRFATAFAGGDPALLVRAWCAWASIADDSGQSDQAYDRQLDAVAFGRASGQPAVLAGLKPKLAFAMLCHRDRCACARSG